MGRCPSVGSIPGRSPLVKNTILHERPSPHNRVQRDAWLARGHADPTSGIQRLVSYLVSSTPSGNGRVSTRLRFTQLSRAVKNGVPPPTRTGWVTST